MAEEEVNYEDGWFADHKKGLSEDKVAEFRTLGDGDQQRKAKRTLRKALENVDANHHEDDIFTPDVLKNLLEDDYGQSMPLPTRAGFFKHSLEFMQGLEHCLKYSNEESMWGAQLRSFATFYAQYRKAQGAKFIGNKYLDEEWKDHVATQSSDLTNRLIRDIRDALSFAKTITLRKSQVDLDHLYDQLKERTVALGQTVKQEVMLSLYRGDIYRRCRGYKAVLQELHHEENRITAYQELKIFTRTVRQKVWNAFKNTKPSLFPTDLELAESMFKLTKEDRSRFVSKDKTPQKAPGGNISPQTALLEISSRIDKLDRRLELLSPIKPHVSTPFPSEKKDLGAASKRPSAPPPPSTFSSGSQETAIITDNHIINTQGAASTVVLREQLQDAEARQFNADLNESQKQALAVVLDNEGREKEDQTPKVGDKHEQLNTSVASQSGYNKQVHGGDKLVKALENKAISSGCSDCRVKMNAYAKMDENSCCKGQIHRYNLCDSHMKSIVKKFKQGIDPEAQSTREILVYDFRGCTCEKCKRFQEKVSRDSKKGRITIFEGVQLGSLFSRFASRFKEILSRQNSGKEKQKPEFQQGLPAIPVLTDPQLKILTDKVQKLEDATNMDNFNTVLSKFPSQNNDQSSWQGRRDDDDEGDKSSDEDKNKKPSRKAPPPPRRGAGRGRDDPPSSPDDSSSDDGEGDGNRRRRESHRRGSRRRRSLTTSSSDSSLSPRRRRRSSRSRQQRSQSTPTDGVPSSNSTVLVKQLTLQSAGCFVFDKNPIAYIPWRSVVDAVMKKNPDDNAVKHSQIMKYLTGQALKTVQHIPIDGDSSMHKVLDTLHSAFYKPQSLKMFRIEMLLSQKIPGKTLDNADQIIKCRRFIQYMKEVLECDTSYNIQIDYEHIINEIMTQHDARKNHGKKWLEKCTATAEKKHSDFYKDHSEDYRHQNLAFPKERFMDLMSVFEELLRIEQYRATYSQEGYHNAAFIKNAIKENQQIERQRIERMQGKPSQPPNQQGYRNVRSPHAYSTTTVNGKRNGRQNSTANAVAPTGGARPTPGTGNKPEKPVRKCIFCGGDHWAPFCSNVTFGDNKANDRLYKALKAQKCINCLGPEYHRANNCPKSSQCGISGCVEKHAKFFHGADFSKIREYTQKLLAAPVKQAAASNQNGQRRVNFKRNRNRSRSNNRNNNNSRNNSRSPKRTGGRRPGILKHAGEGTDDNNDSSK